MTSFLNPSRRGFLQATAAAGASLIFPESLLAVKPDKSFWFVAETGDSWPVANPVLWSIENAREPLLERATEGLLKLSSDDGERIIRLVIRRCKLNLIELHAGQVVIHHWGTQGLADLRPWFKAHGLARRGLEVVLKNRKKETVTTQNDNQYLYGHRLDSEFPLDLYLSKWQSRFKNQPDDWSPAPRTWTGYAWEGVQDNLAPWAALKAAWRRASPMICPNCDDPTLLTNFGDRQVGMLNRSPSFVQVCGACCRSYQDESVKDVASWIVANLDAEVRPEFQMIWSRRVKWKMA